MEIERKYLLTQEQLQLLVSDMNGFVLETRYYLYCNDDDEIRFTRRGTDVFTLDRIQLLQDQTDEYFVRKKERIVISEAEFESLVKIVGDQQPVERLHFKLNDQIELKVYQGRRSGLIRAEVEFESIEAANTYHPDFAHAGEITNSPIGRDVLLAGLNQDEIARLTVFKS